MKTVQVSRRSASYRRRLLAAGALSAVVALSHVDSVAAIACAPDTYYDGTTTTGSGGSSFDSAADCLACPTGTTAAATPDGSAQTFCDGVKTGFAGTAGSGADATITGCASGYYIATPATNAASGNTDATGLACAQVLANKYFTTTTTTPLEVAAAEVPTSCPSDSSSTAGSTVMANCLVDAGYYVSAGGGATGTAGTITVAPANHYAAGGVAVDTTTATDIWDGAAGTLATATGAGVTKCPSDSGTGTNTGSTAISACMCAANFYPSSNTCAACASGTTRAGTVSVTGTATCSANSAGAAMPIAAAVAAMAMPLLV